MYEETDSRAGLLRRCSRSRLLFGLRLLWLRFGPLCCAAWVCVTLFAACGWLAGCLAGCVPAAVPADTYGANAAAVARANTAPGAVGFVGVADAAPAAVAGAVKSAGWINGLGALALLAGCVILGHPQLPNAFGFGLALGGVSLLCAGFLLPLYAGWVGAGLLLLLGAVALGRLKGDTIAGAKSTFAGALAPLTNLFSLKP